MKLFLCAGETSGDQRAAALLRELKILRPGVRATAVGGSALAAEGAFLLTDLTRIAPIGLVEVLGELGTYRHAMHRAADWCARERPDAAVLVDFPDFNLRLAARLKGLGIPVVYYVSPQVWAWRPGRVKEIARVVRRMLVLFDFEEEIYRKAGVDVVWVGHPVADEIPAPAAGPRKEGLVGLLPGSRPKEAARLMPVLAVAAGILARKRPDLRFVAAPGPAVPAETVQGFPVGKAADLMREASLLLVASGTATLEAALHGAPMVVVYKVSPATAVMGRMLMKLKEFSLANILSGGGTVPECIQSRATGETVAGEALALLEDAPRRKAMSERLGTVRSHLGPPGASRRAAQAVLEVVERPAP